MCGRTVMPGRYDIMRNYNVHNVGKRAPMETEQKVYTPGTVVPAVVLRRNMRILTGMHWGYGEVYNARVETVKSKSFWADSYDNRRMVFPISAFWERHWFASAEPMAAAGIYRVTIKEGKRQLEASMLTQSSTDIVSRSHPRMPVFIPLNQLDSWLDGSKDVTQVARELELEYA